jgi:hypothetical protein
MATERVQVHDANECACIRPRVVAEASKIVADACIGQHPTPTEDGMPFTVFISTSRRPRLRLDAETLNFIESLD